MMTVKHEDMETVTHVAGPIVGIKRENRFIQRCAWCGAILIDTKNTETLVSDALEPGRVIRGFGESRLVRVKKGSTVDINQSFHDPIPLPKDFCFKLAE
jgi:hypothetical protein